MSPDPAVASRVPSSLLLAHYVYGNLNPLIHVDPDGERALIIIGDPRAFQSEGRRIEAAELPSYRKAVGSAVNPFLREANRKDPLIVQYGDKQMATPRDDIDEVVIVGHAGVVKIEGADGTSALAPALLPFSTKEKDVSGNDVGAAVVSAAPKVESITTLGCNACSTTNDDRRSLGGDVRTGASSAAKRPVEVKGLETKGRIDLGPKSGAVKSAKFANDPSELVPAPGEVYRPNLQNRRQESGGPP